jgi:hypothetical protein
MDRVQRDESTPDDRELARQRLRAQLPHRQSDRGVVDQLLADRHEDLKLEDSPRSREAKEVAGDDQPDGRGHQVRIVHRRRPAREPRPKQGQEPLCQLRGRDRVVAHEPLVELTQLDLARICHTGPSTRQVRRRQAQVTGDGAEMAVGGDHDGPIIGDRRGRREVDRVVAA